MRVGSEGAFTLQGLLVERSFRGPFVRAVVEVNHQRLTFNVPVHERLPAPGEPLTLSFNPEEALQILP